MGIIVISALAVLVFVAIMPRTRRALQRIISLIADKARIIPIKDYLAVGALYTFAALMFFLEGCLFLFRPGQHEVALDTWQKAMVPGGVSLLGVLAILVLKMWFGAPPQHKWWEGLYENVMANRPLQKALASIAGTSVVTGVLTIVMAHFGQFFLASLSALSSVISLVMLVCIVHLHGASYTAASCKKA